MRVKVRGVKGGVMVGGSRGWSQGGGQSGLVGRGFR